MLTRCFEVGDSYTHSTSLFLPSTQSSSKTWKDRYWETTLAVPGYGLFTVLLPAGARLQMACTKDETAKTHLAGLGRNLILSGVHSLSADDSMFCSI